MAVPFILLLLLPFTPLVAQYDPTPPATTVKLVFIHHSTGEGWLRPEEGDLVSALNANNYYVRDTNYDWGPFDAEVNDGANIGSHTDIGHWYNWFLGPSRNSYLSTLYTNNFLTDGIEQSPTINDPGGENRIVMFKSCFTSAGTIYGEPGDPPLPKGVDNPIRGVGIDMDAAYTVSNIKGLYRDLLDYFVTRPDKLFILVTTPPRCAGNGDEAMPKLRAINNWLVSDLLAGYSRKNVFVFDYYTILTSNGGDPNTNDIGSVQGGHHRLRNGVIEHLTGNSNFNAYGTWDESSQSWDDHPTGAGHRKATAEFLPLLNIAYNRWKQSFTDVDPISSAAEGCFLELMYPNPFRESTTIGFRLATSRRARISVYDRLGREMRTLVDAELAPGVYRYRLDGTELPAGTYFVRMTTGMGSVTRRMMLIR